MDFLVLDRKEKLLTVLSNADGLNNILFKAVLKEQLSNMYTLELEVNANTPESLFIVEENHILFKDLLGEWQLFVIKEITQEHDVEQIKYVYCESSSQELLDEICGYEMSSFAKTAKDQLTSIIAGTRFEVGNVDTSSTHWSTTNSKNKSVLEAIHLLRDQFDYEIAFRYTVVGSAITHRYVDMKAILGVWSGKRYEYTKDVDKFVKITDTTDLKTAIQPVGGMKDGTKVICDIKTAVWTFPANPLAKPSGQAFLEDTTATALYGYGTGTPKKRILYYENTEITDPLLLLADAYKVLKPLTVPKITYTIDVVDLYAMTGDTDLKHESVKTGDKVVVVDYDFVPSMAVVAIIIERNVDLLAPENTSVTLGNFVKSLSNFKRPAITKNFTWIKYALTPTTGMQDFPDGMAYMGVAHNKVTDVESTDYDDYAWSLVKGNDGATGSAGADGADGATGATGATGAKGDTGLTGLQGATGSTGLTGSVGANGLTSYFHVKYSNDGLAFTANAGETVGTWIGTLVDNTPADSSTFGAYAWVLVKGATGTTGTTGIAGTNGADGVTSYLHIKYSDDGVTFTASTGEVVGKYIGTLVDTTPADSSTFSDYTWVLIKGADGATGAQGNAGMKLTYTLTGMTADSQGRLWKTGGTGFAWDASAYSAEGYTNGCFLTFKPAQIGLNFMVGLNGNPSTMVSHTDMDYYFYIQASGSVSIYENGVSIVVAGTYVAGDVLAITYDGVNVRYYLKGILVRTKSTTSGQTLYFDSSFLSQSATYMIYDIGFAPIGSQGVQGLAGVDANLLPWVADWNTGVTVVGGKSIVTPRLFAGTNVGGLANGVAFGKDILTGTETGIGLVLYKDNVPVTTLDSSGLVISHPDVATKTIMDADGINIYSQSDILNENALGSLVGNAGSFSTLTVNNIVAQNILTMQKEDETIYVNGTTGNDANDGTSGFPLRTIQTAIDSLNKIFDDYLRKVVIYAYGLCEEDITIENFTGVPSMVSTGWTNNPGIIVMLDRTCVLQGSIKVNNCTIPIVIDGARGAYNDTGGALIKATGSAGNLLQALGSSNVIFTSLRIQGMGISPAVVNGIFFGTSSGNIMNIDMWDLNRGVIAGFWSRLFMSAFYGSRISTGIQIDKGSIINTPSGATQTSATIKLTNNDGQYLVSGGGTPTAYASYSSPSAPVLPTTTQYTASYATTSTKSWRDNWGWRTDTSDLYQGVYGSNGTHRGMMIFNSAAIRTALSGATINGCKLYLKRNSSGGSSSAMPVTLYGHVYDATGGGTTLSVNYGVIGSWSWGQSKYVTIPIAVATALKSGAIHGLAIYSTGNYAIFNPSATFQVTYTK